jgi:hypothetical protein
MKKVLCFDLDGVICKTLNNNYKASKPIKKNIIFINKLFKKNYIIKIFTARFMGKFNDNIFLAKKKGLSLTKKQLKKWKVNYHYLIMGKPAYDLIVDDKAYGFNTDWIKDIKKYIN